MRIIYIEFGISKSKQYKKMCGFAKQFPHYSYKDGITSCYVNTIEEYIKVQHAFLSMVETVKKWKNSKVLLFERPYLKSVDYYNFLKTLKFIAGKYKIFIRDGKQYNPALGRVTYEDLPFPIVYYPGYFGAFFAFSKDIGGKLYFCECERLAIENYIKLREMRLEYSYDKEECFLESGCFPPIVASMSKKYKLSPIEKFEFKEKLCFRCNNKIPQEAYCHSMYGGIFKQRFGWYIKQEELKRGIDSKSIGELNILPDECSPELYDYVIRLSKLMRTNIYGTVNNGNAIIKLRREYENLIENIVREQMGYPIIGNAWTSETILYNIVKEMYPNYTVKRHYRPKWLEGLELDIYIPDIQLAFEYQGIQHFKAVEHWGGTKQLDIQKEHDKRKAQICSERGVRLVCINYDEDLTNDYVQKRVELLSIE